MRKIAVAGILSLFLASCGTDHGASVSDTVKTETKPLSYYEETFDKAFAFNQKTATEIPKDGDFDFSLETNVDGESSAMEKLFSEFPTAIQSFAIKTFGSYDFNDTQKPKLDANVKAYLNSGNTGLGDFDAKFEVDGSEAYATFSNLSNALLTALNLDESTKDSVMKSFEDNKGKRIPFPILSSIVSATITASEQENAGLVKNTADQEKAIVDSFVRNDVLKVVSGSTSQDGTDRVFFELNHDNLVKFLNETAQTLGESKDFSGDAKLSEAVKMEGHFDIRDSKFVDSDIKTLLRLENGTDVKDLVIKTKLSLPNPKNASFDAEFQIYANESPNNVLRLRAKGSVK